MRIAILTLPFHGNYGGIMQAYALQRVLRDMGHEVYVAQGNVYSKKYSKKRYLLYLGLKYARPVVTFLIPRLKGKILDNPKNKRHGFRKLRKFVYSEMKIVPCLNENNISNYDVAIVGSDQVWRKGWVDIDYYTLGFTRYWKGKRLVYAASFGNGINQFEKEEGRKAHNNLEKFDLVTVREDSAKEMCRLSFGIEAQTVLDPTLLLDVKRYEELIKKNYPHEGLFYYTLDNSDYKLKRIHQLSEKLNVNNFTVGPKAGIDWMGEERTHKYNDVLSPAVEEWLSAFKKAQYIITDSYHGTIFSILFQKPFLTILNYSRGQSRMTDLLGKLGLSDRHINSFDELSISKLTQPVDWGKVNQRISILRQTSLNTLLKHLKDA